MAGDWEKNAPWRVKKRQEKRNDAASQIGVVAPSTIKG
jgi:hypothetical protein